MSATAKMPSPRCADAPPEAGAAADAPCWSDVRILVEVARCGSYARAAEAVGASKTTLGRRIAALERTLGVALFARGAGGVVPTEAARDALAAAGPMAEAAERVRAAVRRAAEPQALPVRVAAPPEVALDLLAPALGGRAPAVHPLAPGCVALPPRLPRIAYVDEASEEAEVRLVAAPGGEVPTGLPKTARVRRVATVAHVPVAGRTYLLDFPEAAGAGDLRGHRFAVLAAPPASPAFAAWTRIVEAAGGRATTYASALLLAEAVRSGVGVGLLPQYLLRQDEELVAVPFTGVVAETGLWLCAHPEALRAPGVRSVYDALVRLFEPTPRL